MDTCGQQVDDVLMALGGNSKYQHLHNLIITFSFLSAAFQLLDMIYIGKMVPHQCAAPPNGTLLMLDGSDVPVNSTVKYNECNIDIIYNTTDQTLISRSLPCIYGMQYSQRKDISVISEFDLVCDKEALGDLPQTLLILGQAIGALTLPLLSDRYGRKPVHVLSHIAVMAFGIGIGFAPDYVTFAVMRLGIGAVQQGIVLTIATYSVETFPTKYRRVVGFISLGVWRLCALTMTVFGYFLRHESWRTLQWTFSAMSIYVIIQIVFLDESFRWLVANGKYKIALKNLKKAIKLNKADEKDVLDKFYLLIGAVKKHSSEDLKPDRLLDNSKLPIEKYSFLIIFKRRRMVINIMIFWYLWCSSALCFFGLFFTSTSLSGDPYLNIFLNTLMEVPPCFMFYFLVDRIGRRLTTAVFFGMGGVCLLIATIVNATASGSVFITVFTLVGKIGATGAFGIVFFYTPEVYPTNIRGPGAIFGTCSLIATLLVKFLPETKGKQLPQTMKDMERNIGLGSSSIAARVGGMLAPFSRMLSHHIPWGPGAIFGTCSLITTLLVQFLPETKGKQLPQTMEDMETLYETSAKNKPENEDSINT